MAESGDIEELVRDRLRSLRRSQGWSLDDLGRRANLSASTISRIETGRRTIGIDVLVALAGALQVDLGSLLGMRHEDDDVVIRPVASWRPGTTIWPLSHGTGSTTAIKMRIEPTDESPGLQVHPGHDWFFVLDGRVRLTLGDRAIVVETGEAAEFTTMTPHAVEAVDSPAELVMVVDRDGQRAHLHH